MTTRTQYGKVNVGSATATTTPATTCMRPMGAGTGPTYRSAQSVLRFTKFTFMKRELSQSPAIGPTGSERNLFSGTGENSATIAHAPIVPGFVDPCRYTLRKRKPYPKNRRDFSSGGCHILGVSDLTREAQSARHQADKPHLFRAQRLYDCRVLRNRSGAALRAPVKNNHKDYDDASHYPRREDFRIL